MHVCRWINHNYNVYGPKNYVIDRRKIYNLSWIIMYEYGRCLSFYLEYTLTTVTFVLNTFKVQYWNGLARTSVCLTKPKRYRNLPTTRSTTLPSSYCWVSQLFIIWIYLVLNLNQISVCVHHISWVNDVFLLSSTTICLSFHSYLNDSVNVAEINIVLSCFRLEDYAIVTNFAHTKTILMSGMELVFFFLS